MSEASLLVLGQCEEHTGWFLAVPGLCWVRGHVTPQAPGGLGLYGGGAVYVFPLSLRTLEWSDPFRIFPFFQSPW